LRESRKVNEAAKRLEKLAGELVRDLVRLVVQERVEGLLELAAGKQEAGKRGPGRPQKSEAQPEPKVAKKKGGRRKSAEVKGLVDRVVELAREKGGQEGVSARELAEGLGLEMRELTRPVQKALGEKRLKKKGERQFTRYVAVG